MKKRRRRSRRKSVSIESISCSFEIKIASQWHGLYVSIPPTAAARAEATAIIKRYEERINNRC